MTSYFNFFPFSWHHTDEYFLNNKQCILRIFGWNEKNESVAIRINDFNIPVWVELPENEEWTEGKRLIVSNFFKKLSKDPQSQPCMIKYHTKYKLYNSNISLNPEGDKYIRKKYPILQLDFKNAKAASYFGYALKEEIKIPELGNQKYKFTVHSNSNSITPILKYMAMFNLPSASWIRGKGKLQTGESKESTKTIEYIVSCKDLKTHSNYSSFPIIYPKVLSWDIETYSMDENSMPKSDRAEDVIFLISCVISEYKQKEQIISKYCLSSVDTDNTLVDKDTKVIKVKNEYSLLKGFGDFIRQHDPDILIGYNIMGYDLKYMIARAELHSCYNEFANLSCIPGKIGKEEHINWGSSARGKQDMVYIEAYGRVWIDLLPYIRMNHNFSNYKLSTVCQEILKTDNKDDLKIKDMFSYYRNKDSVGLASAVNYCTQDSNVVLLLWTKCLIWFDITETANTCCIPPFYIIAKAQQIRIVSQMLNYCIKNNIILETNIYKPAENEFYEGATVTEPISGLYKNVVPFDFASLYPSIIMAYNIDYSTIVNDDSIPDEDCHILEWETHTACDCPKSDGTRPKKNKKGLLKIICAKYKYRWLKESDKTYKGVIPTLIKNLIDARKKTRKMIEENKKLIKNETCQLKINELIATNSVLDKRQLAYKVSANSMYGIMGASEGYLPFLPGAMSVTKVGRDSILKASSYIEKNHKGKVIYNDTDSAYTIFPHMDDKPMEELWKYANMIVDDIAKLFLAPMKLEFEEMVYTQFLIFSKKRYVGLQANEKGVVSDKWKISGIVLKRRDNCRVLKELYKHMIEYVLNNTKDITILDHIYKHHILKNKYKKEKTGVTLKKRREHEQIDSDLKIIESQMKIWELNSRQNPTIKTLLNIVDSYISDMFLTSKYKPIDFVITKGLTKDVYASKTLPPHVAVSNKMKLRNIIVQQNDRIEYILIDRGCKPGTPETQDLKAEDYNFQQENCDWVKVDYLYYLEKQIIKPIDQILEVACGVYGFAEECYTYRLNHKNMVYQLKQLYKPKIIYE